MTVVDQDQERSQRGHVYDDENTRYTSSDRRDCRACARARRRVGYQPQAQPPTRPSGQPDKVQHDHWREQAACRTEASVLPAEAWFEEGGRSAEPAKAVCAGCPVREACPAYALRTQQP